MTKHLHGCTKLGFTKVNLNLENYGRPNRKKKDSLYKKWQLIGASFQCKCVHVDMIYNQNKRIEIKDQVKKEKNWKDVNR